MKIKLLFYILFSFILFGCARLNQAPKFQYEYVSNFTSENKKFYGYVKSALTTNLSFQSEGKINFLPYSKGDFIKKGQVIARLDGVFYKIKKQEEQIRLKELAVQLKKNESYFERMDTLHKNGAISDNDWEESYYDFRAKQEEVKIQKEKINYIDKEISYNIIIAPFDGFIVEKFLDVESYAKIGQAIVSFAKNDDLIAETIVDDSIINEIKLEEKVLIKRENKKYKGKISHISKNSLNSGGYLVKITFEDNFKDLNDGQDVEIEFYSNKNLSTYVPLNSIFEENGEKYVYKIIKNDKKIAEIQKQKIEIGEISDNSIQVLKGLNPQDLIILNNLDKIKNLEKIKL